VYWTLFFLILVPHLYHYLIGFDVKILVTIVVKIVVIVTVSFLNFYLTFKCCVTLVS
jgi:hypothetical protein